ncbi:MAG: hypothetical protein AAFV53_27955, partial [Myxococcota bacterium]
MRSCLILGSGRSGTSMVAGSLARSGYFMGRGLHAARAANPKGFFEDADINNLNDALIRQLRPQLGGGQGWLADLGVQETVTAPGNLTAALQQLTRRQPFCFKDPRFSYTVSAWRPFLPADTGMICVFRHPALTAKSIVEECARASYLSDVEMNTQKALQIWASMYRQILQRHRTEGPQPWLFVHYNQMLDGSGQKAMEQFLEAPIDASFADKTLRRSPPEMALPAEVVEIYQALCELAGYEDAPQTNIEDQPRVSVIAIAGPQTTPDELSRIHANVSRQRGVQTELVVVDFTDDGDLRFDGADIVVRSPSISRGEALKAGADAATGDFWALSDGRCWRLPNQLARAVEAINAYPQAMMVVSDYNLSQNGDRFSHTVNFKGLGAHPPPGWMAGALMRPAAAEAISQKAFWPTELQLLQTFRSRQQVLHIAEPLFSIETAAFEAGSYDAGVDAAVIQASQEPWEDGALLTVSLCSYNR